MSTATASEELGYALFKAETRAFFTTLLASRDESHRITDAHGPSIGLKAP